MRYTFIVICCCFLFSCSDSFINHKLKSEKIRDCTAYSRTIKLISNINGERYEFYSCMDDGFNGSNYTLVRKGDSIVVSFPKTGNQKQSLFKLILDVDAKPGYRHIMIDEREVALVPYQK